MPEPTILDYLKSLFTSHPIDLKEYFEDGGIGEKAEVKKKGTTSSCNQNNWGIVFGFVCALTAQYFLEPERRQLGLAVILYSFSALLIFCRKQNCGLRDEVGKADSEIDGKLGVKLYRPYMLYFSLFLEIAAFFSFSNHSFKYLNLSLWISGLLFFIGSFWNFKFKKPTNSRHVLLHLSLLGLVLICAAFFRFYMLEEVPGEMFSDHAEKLLDVMDILDGQRPVYFPRNTGREALQFYVTAMLIQFFNVEIGFMSLKIGTALAGLLSLPFIYLFTKEIFNKWAGLLAAFFCGIAYWPNVISRVGLRFPFYPLFVAPVLYFLIRGLKFRNSNNILLSGIFLGMGLHGYSPIRILPILVGLIFLIFLIYEKSIDHRKFALQSFVILALTSLIIFIPLLCYMIDEPGIVSYRSLSRLTGIENPITGSPIAIFMKNLWKSLTMFFYQNGVVWVHSVPNRPALGIVSAALLFTGTANLIRNRAGQKGWIFFTLLISIPVLMLPSILSLAYPMENPALNRSSGAVVPVFAIVGYGMFEIIENLVIRMRKPVFRTAGIIFALCLVLISMEQNYRLVFDQYHHQFLVNAWNTSDMGNVIAEFIREGGDKNHAYVVPYPHWVDTRLVGINAGFPRKDYALWPEDFAGTTKTDGKKLFILKPEDEESLHALELLYPEAKSEIFYSEIPGKNFIKFVVPE